MLIGNLRCTSENAPEQKNKQITILLFLSAKEIPDNDLLNRDLKVLLPQISWLKYEQAIKFGFGESR